LSIIFTNIINIPLFPLLEKVEQNKGKGGEKIKEKVEKK
jgi:hypothetical protein